MSNAFDWSRYAVGGATRPDSFTGMDAGFRSSLEALFAAAPPELGLQVGSGYRSIERQRELWEASDKSGRMVARPGRSKHNHGTAADLSAAGRRLDKASPEARQWVHDNAAAYGLHFPMSWEPWHIEPIGSRDGDPGHEHNSAPSQPSTGDATMAGYPSSLRGILGMMPEAEPEQEGIGGFLNSSSGGDLLQALGMSLMSSPRQAPLSGMAEILPGMQDRSQKRADMERDRAALAGALQYAGFSPEDAAAFSTSTGAANVAISAKEDQRARTLLETSGNRTADWLDGQGEPELAEMARSGDAKTALELYRGGTGRGGKAPNLETIYTDDGREQKGYFDRNGEWVPVGGVKAPKGGSGPGGDLTATEKKAVFTAEDDVLIVDNTIDKLKRARDLNDKTYSGRGASMRADWGYNLGIGGEAAEATREYEGLMTGEAAAEMAATLKGATTDRELDIFVRIISDLNQPPEVRKRTIDRMLALAERRRETLNRRADELRGGTYFDPDGGSSRERVGGAGAAPGGGGGGADNDPLGIRGN